MGLKSKTHTKNTDKATNKVCQQFWKLFFKKQFQAFSYYIHFDT